MQNQETYKIVRMFLHSERKVTVKRGLSLEEAQEWCRDPETSSRTCTRSPGKARTRNCGPWFDGYSPEN